MTRNSQAQNRKMGIRGTVLKFACPEHNKLRTCEFWYTISNDFKTCESQDIRPTHAKYRTNWRTEARREGAVPYMRNTGKLLKTCELWVSFSESRKSGASAVRATGHIRNMRVLVRYFGNCELRYGISETANCGYSVPNMRVSVHTQLINYYENTYR